MKTRLFAGALGILIMLAPVASAAAARRKPQMSADMRRAIAFQRQKDRADARQARIEARRPEAFRYTTEGSANRSMEEAHPNRRIVKDQGEPQYRRDMRRK